MICPRVDADIEQSSIPNSCGSGNQRLLSPRENRPGDLSSPAPGERTVSVSWREPRAARLDLLGRPIDPTSRRDSIGPPAFTTGRTTHPGAAPRVWAECRTKRPWRRTKRLAYESTLHTAMAIRVESFHSGGPALCQDSIAHSVRRWGSLRPTTSNASVIVPCASRSSRRSCRGIARCQPQPERTGTRRSQAGCRYRTERRRAAPLSP